MRFDGLNAMTGDQSADESRQYKSGRDEANITPPAIAALSTVKVRHGIALRLSRASRMRQSTPGVSKTEKFINTTVQSLSILSPLIAGACP